MLSGVEAQALPAFRAARSICHSERSQRAMDTLAPARFVIPAQGSFQKLLGGCYSFAVGGRRPRLPLDYLGYVLQTGRPGGLPRTISWVFGRPRRRASIFSPYRVSEYGWTPGLRGGDRGRGVFFIGGGRCPHLPSPCVRVIFRSRGKASIVSIVAESEDSTATTPGDYLHIARTTSYWRTPVCSLRIRIWMPDQVRHDNIGIMQKNPPACSP